MVKAFDAAIADGAVAAAWRAQDETVWAHFARVDLLEEVEEVVPLVEVARVARRGHEEADGDDGAEDGNDVGKDVLFLF